MSWACDLVCVYNLQKAPTWICCRSLFVIFLLTKSSRDTGSNNTSNLPSSKNKIKKTKKGDDNKIIACKKSISWETKEIHHTASTTNTRNLTSSPGSCAINTILNTDAVPSVGTTIGELAKWKSSRRRWRDGAISTSGLSSMSRRGFLVVATGLPQKSWRHKNN